MNEIETATRILRAGGLVAFPTETVYGLGADAANAAAVRRIYDAKGRPPTNPLIVHVADAGVARRYAAAWPEAAAKLAAAFWPGPLTLVLPRREGPGGVVPPACAGGATVGLRAPDHPLALELLRAFDGPVAAPSANRSNRVSPTTARHVRDELGEAVGLILDGGPCRVGIESTVLDLSHAVPAILRPGGVSREQIERVVGPVRLAAATLGPESTAASPGQQAVHYAPRTPALRFERSERRAFEDWARPGRRLAVRAVVLQLSPPMDRAPLAGAGVEFVAMPDAPAEYAARLYAELRDWDAKGLDAIVVEMPPDEPGWLAVRDRLRRATRPL